MRWKNGRFCGLDGCCGGGGAEPEKYGPLCDRWLWSTGVDLVAEAGSA